MNNNQTESDAIKLFDTTGIWSVKLLNFAIEFAGRAPENFFALGGTTGRKSFSWVVTRERMFAGGSHCQMVWSYVAISEKIP